MRLRKLLKIIGITVGTLMLLGVIGISFLYIISKEFAPTGASDLDREFMFAVTNQEQIDYGRLDSLLEIGVDINAGVYGWKDFVPHGQFPLHSAVISGDTTLIRYLLDHGAEVDCRNWRQITPLMYAVGGNSHQSAKLLIEAGADVNVVAVYHANVRSILSSCNDDDLRQLLIGHGATIRGEIRLFQDIQLWYKHYRGHNVTYQNRESAR